MKGVHAQAAVLGAGLCVCEGPPSHVLGGGESVVSEADLDGAHWTSLDAVGRFEGGEPVGDARLAEGVAAGLHGDCLIAPLAGGLGGGASFARDWNSVAFIVEIQLGLRVAVGKSGRIFVADFGKNSEGVI